MNGEASHSHQPSSSSASIIIMVMPIRDGWRHHAFHPSGFRPLGLCLRHPQVMALPILEARPRLITLSTQNGGSYARMRVTRIDVAIDDREDELAWTHHVNRDDPSTRRSGGRCRDRAGPPLLIEPYVDGAAAPARGHRTGTSSVEWTVNTPKASSE